MYAVLAHKKIRCLRVRNDTYTEKQTSWGTKRTEEEAWKESIDAIDDSDKKRRDAAE